MMRVEATKFGSPNLKFRSANQKFGCHKPHNFFIGLTKNEGLPDQNFTLNQSNRPSQKVGSAYKISMSVEELFG